MAGQRIGVRIIVRLEVAPGATTFRDVVAAVAEESGEILAVDLVQRSSRRVIRDLTIALPSADHLGGVVRALERLPKTRVLHVSDRTFLMHLGGKIEIAPRVPIKNRDDLATVYTPEVARVCQAIADDPSNVYTLTIKRNTVAIVTDGTAVLGLGDVGPEAALPVMEGKALLFKRFAGVDAFPLCLTCRDVDEIVRTVVHIAPAFGAINLEDISAPRCFAVEERLAELLPIPVFHDDQHGTAVVVAAGLLNALKVVGKRLEEAKVVVCGIGAAGVACTRLLQKLGARDIVGVDREGILVPGTPYRNPVHEAYARTTNPRAVQGGLREALAGADVLIGVSAGSILRPEDLAVMAPDPIVFALANPEPEVDPDEAAPYVRVLATGRSDYPNQINNVLCFPGLFRGVLDCRAATINDEMKVAAARALADVIPERDLDEEYVIPSVFNKDVVSAVSRAVVDAARRTGVARRR